MVRTAITTTGERATGIFGQYNSTTGGLGDLDIDAADVTISTSGNRAGGIWGLLTMTQGDLNIHVRDSSITTVGNHNEAFGIRGSHNVDSGRLVITAREGFTISTSGNYARGVWVAHLCRQPCAPWHLTMTSSSAFRYGAIRREALGGCDFLLTQEPVWHGRH